MARGSVEMKNLYKVEAMWYVMAEDEMEAQILKPDAIDETSIFVMEASEVGVDADWWDAIPFNSDTDKTCGQIMEELEKLQKEASK